MLSWGQALDAAASTQSDHAIVTGACPAALRAGFAPTLLSVAGNPSCQPVARSHRPRDRNSGPQGSVAHRIRLTSRAPYGWTARFAQESGEDTRMPELVQMTEENPRNLDALPYTGFTRC